MASLEKRNGSFRIIFRFASQKFSRSLRTRDERTANASLARLEDNLRRVELGTLTPPDDIDIAAFLLSDGQSSGRAKKVKPSIRTLGRLCDAYTAALPRDSIEESTRGYLDIHIRHLRRILKSTQRIQSLALEDLQKYVDTRRKEPGLRGKKVSATTIQKEIKTLSGIWNWASETGYVDRPLPKKGIRYPKTEEKLPFQTWSEIERKIKRGGLSASQQADLWDCLFLTLPEIDEFLTFVRTAARHPFIYPMLAFAAHTGARRSEMLRSRLEDIDLEGRIITIREKKRKRGTLTTRSVPISPFLGRVLETWLNQHPGGQCTFCLGKEVVRSSKTREGFREITRDQAHDHFKRTLKGSKWDKLRGWHVFRHSFCSNCAAKGIDQRIINAWVGHQTEEMVRRYRHLIPNQQQEAIQTVFGNVA